MMKGKKAIKSDERKERSEMNERHLRAENVTLLFEKIEFLVTDFLLINLFSY